MDNRPQPPSNLPFAEPLLAPVRFEWVLRPLIAHGAALILLVGSLAKFVPRFQSMFASFGRDLPAVTSFILGVSAAVREHLVLVSLALVVFLAGDVFLYVRLRRRGSKALAALLWWVVLVLALTGFLTVILSVFLAFIGMMTSIGAAAASGG